MDVLIHFYGTHLLRVPFGTRNRRGDEEDAHRDQ